MTTMIIDVQNSGDAKRIASALRLMKSVKRVTVQENELERIPGLAYTREAVIESAIKATEEYRKGIACITQEEARREAASW